MKKAKLILTASMFAFMGMSLMTSCTKDDKVCDPGYEGSNCDIQIRTPMLGTYSATDIKTQDQSSVTYTAVISTNATASVVNISNFGDFYTNTELVTSNVQKSGDNISFTIPDQKPDNVYKVSGEGIFNTSTKKISITYALDDGLTIMNFTGNWTMQP